MKKFFITKNPDNDDKFLKALLGAGFIESGIAEADFIVHDSIRREVVKAIGNRPAFVIPHTPQSWFLWDGLCGIFPTVCNFVSGSAAIEGMKAYGYPYRVEAIGFPRCEVREFRQSKGNNLLFAPSHSLENGDYVEPNYIEKAMRVFNFITSNRAAFGRVTMCWDPQREAKLSPSLRKYGIDFIPTAPKKDKEPLKRMMERIEKADLVVSCGTAGCVSVAMGKPTIFCTESGVPHTPPNGVARNFEKYESLIRHPNMIERMTIQEVLSVMREESEAARKWRIGNIGGDFDGDKFISVILEGLENYKPPPFEMCIPLNKSDFKCPYCPSRNARIVRRNRLSVQWQCVKCKRKFTTKETR